jgi:hypothetical protein
MTLLNKALSNPKCLISVMGDHAGENSNSIFDRKSADIARIGKTFWLIKSPKARPAKVQEICSQRPVYIIFVEPGITGGARPTTKEDAAREYSPDGQSWYSFPEGLSPVTGKLDRGAAALVFDVMTTNVSGALDLWSYADFSDVRKPIKFILGCSTVCAVKKDMTSHPDKMKSRHRGIVAVAKLVEPYCVSLR